LIKKNTLNSNTASLEPIISYATVSENSGPQHLQLDAVHTIPEHRIIRQRIRAKSICGRLLSRNFYGGDSRSSRNYRRNNRSNLMATTLKSSSTHETRKLIEKFNSPVIHLPLPRTKKCEKIFNPPDEVRPADGSNSITSEMNLALVNETSLKVKEERTNRVSPEIASEVANQSIEKTKDLCQKSKEQTKLYSNTESSGNDWWTKQEKFKAQRLKIREKKDQVSFLEQFGKKRCHSVDFSNTRIESHSYTKSPKKPSASCKTSVGGHKLRNRRMTPYVGNMSSEIQFSSKLCPKNKTNAS